MAVVLRLHHGTPTPFVDGVPQFPAYLWTTPPTDAGYAAAAATAHFAAAGIHLHAFDVGVGREWCGPAAGRASHFDFGTMERRLGHILDADPQARFHLRIQLEMDPGQTWWHALYPGEREIDSDGCASTQSFASRVWRQQAGDFLVELAGHLQRIGLAERIFAYQTGAGHTGEWVKGLTAMRTPCGDYSAPMQAHFRAWLRRQYGGDPAALRDAWQDGTAGFEQAAVPPASAQWHACHWTFRDPRREQPVIDYYRCLAELCAELIDEFCRRLKQVVGDQSLTGAFYGYLLELAWNAGFFAEGPDSPYSTYQRSGHLGLGRVLRSPHVDFLVSPYSYGFRGLGGHGPAMLPGESVRAHGKLYIYEDDTRTHLAPALAGFGRARCLDDSIAILRRNFAEVVTRGYGIWWNVGASHVDPTAEPAFRPLLRRFGALGRFALSLDRQPAAEIAVLVDDESFLYTAITNELDVPAVFKQRLWGLPRLGAPADYYLLDDLLEGRVPPCKLYVFLNPWRLDATRRARLAAALRRDDRVALWIYAPGYLADRPATVQVAEVTGFRVGAGEHPWGPQMHLLDFTHPITRDLPEDFTWGTDARLAPILHLEDPEARILGEVVYSQGRCLPGFGVKELPGWRSVFVAAPNLPAPLLRGVARYAGVHLYSTAGDVLYATRQLLAVHTKSGGARTFALPRRVEVVFELFEGRPVATDADSFSVQLAAGSTSLWYTGDAALLAELQR